MGSSQSKNRPHRNNSGHDNPEPSPAHDHPKRNHSTGAQRLREDADRLYRARSPRREYQGEDSPQAVHDTRQPHSPVEQYTSANIHGYQPGSSTPGTARRPKQTSQRRDKPDIKATPAHPTLTENRRRHQQDRSSNQASKTTGNYNDGNDYNQASNSMENYTGEDYNQVSKPIGRYGEGDDYNQVSKPIGRYGAGDNIARQ